MSCEALDVDVGSAFNTPPARSSFDSLLILPDATAPSSAHTAPRKSPGQLYRRLSPRHPWFLEILNAILLLVAIFAIVATLYIHAGQPVPQWPFHITINAMLSIYAVVFKASMAFIQTSCIGQMQWSWFSGSPRPLHDLVLFHDAGQGPWGSLTWLWAHHVRQPAAALGACIIIVAMAVDPFVQQLIQPVDCTEQLRGAPTASVPAANIVTYDGFSDALQPSFMAGFYTRQNLTDFECTTGNCTFAEDYTTLGFCSSCEDVSAKVTITKNCTVISDQNMTGYPGPCGGYSVTSEDFELPVIWNITTSYPPFDLTFYHNWMNTTWWEQMADQDVPYEDDTPDVFTIQASPRFEPYMIASDTLAWPHPNQVAFGVDVGVIYGMSENSIFRQDPRDPQQNLTGCDDASSNNTWYCRGYGAATCLMQPCLRTYSAGVTAGRLTETLVDQTDPEEDWGYTNVDGAEIVKGYFGLVDKGCINAEQQQRLAAEGYDKVSDNQTRWLPYKVTYDPTQPNATAYNDTLSFSLLANHCLFLVDELFVDGIWSQALTGFLLGTVKRYSPGYDPLNEATPIQTTLEDRISLGRTSFKGPDAVRYMWNSGRVNMTGIRDPMENLAQALTFWVRSAGGGVPRQDGIFNRRVTGEVLHYAICAQVAWAWLALPAALTVLTLLLLASTMQATSRGRLPVWKSSPLTMLFHGPGGRYWMNEGLVATNAATKPGSEDTSTKRGMEKFAARVSVKLGDNGGHGELRLRQVSAVSKR